MIQSFEKINKVKGVLTLSGDKSISHRALLIASLANGKSFLKNISESDDVKSTMNCIEVLGTGVEVRGNEVIISGRGYKGFKQPLNPLYAGNSGTTARLLAGILAAQNFESIITGDESLSSRPMRRIIEPLSQMGAHIIGEDDGKLPLRILPSNELHYIKYELPVASAQVKSAVLFAGLHLDEKTTVIESVPTRNHTENLLGLSVIRYRNNILSSASRGDYPEPKEYFIPGDISSAIFFIVLALLTKNSELTIKDICLNTTRIKCLSILKSMGGKIQIEEKGISNNEIFGDVIVKSSELSNIHISNEIIPLIIDEIPVLAIAGIFADGKFELKGASELRVKESDRIKSVCINLKKLGLEVNELDDGFSVSGEAKKISEPFNSFNDHRIAMAFAVLSSLLKDGGKVEGFECASVSNPDFLEQLGSIAY
jgi:3-phosphoshikimate 1-carboxyvinyltransferase